MKILMSRSLRPGQGTRRQWPREGPAEPRSEALTGLLGPIRLALGFGLVAGWLELGLVLAQRALDPHVSMASLRTNRHFVWMIPVSDVLLFGATGLLLGLLGRFRPGLARAISWRCLVALAALAPLLAVERLYGVAGVALACGLGVRGGRPAEALARRLGGSRAPA